MGGLDWREGGGERERKREEINFSAIFFFIVCISLNLEEQSLAKRN